MLPPRMGIKYTASSYFFLVKKATLRKQSLASCPPAASFRGVKVKSCCWSWFRGVEGGKGERTLEQSFLGEILHRAGPPGKGRRRWDWKYCSQVPGAKRERGRGRTAM